MPNDPTGTEIVELLHLVTEQAQTAYVLVTATALEDMLEMALLGSMREMSKTSYADLFTGNGPLSTFASKIEVAYAIRIIDDDLVGDFRGIKSIRNAFAHPREAVLSFRSAKLTKEFQKLTGWNKDVDRRQLFDERVVACIELLRRQIDTSMFILALRKALPGKS